MCYNAFENTITLYIHQYFIIMAEKSFKHSRNAKKQKGFHKKNHQPTDYQRERDSQAGRRRRKGFAAESQKGLV